MEAAKACDAPVIIQASRGARSYANDIMLAKMMEALDRDLSRHPAVHPSGPRQLRSHLPDGHPARLHLRDDGRLARRPTPRRRRATTTMSRITARVAEMAHWVGASVEGELGVLGSLETGEGEAEDGHGAEGKLEPRPAPDRSRPGRRLRRRDQGRRAGDRLRHLARRLQVHPQADRRHPRHERHRGDPRQAAEHAPRHARLVLGAAGTAGHHQRLSAARCPRPSACRSRRSCAASATACARSISTPTAAWP